MADLITFQVAYDFTIEQFTRDVETRKNRILERTGSWVRASMMKKIRPSGSQLTPGRPPRGHAPGMSGLKDVRFDVDKLNDTVRIGPRIYGQPKRTQRNRRGQVRQVITTNVVRLLEEGGTIKTLITYPKSGHSYVRTTTYRQFPWIEPTRRQARVKFREFIREEGFSL